MKVIAFNGSARKGGNTAILLNYVLAEVAEEGIETELVELRGVKIHGCLRLPQVLVAQRPALRAGQR